MPIQKLEKELKSLQKDIDEAIKKSDSRKQNSSKDPNVKAAVSQARVIMEEIHLNYNREQRDKDIEKKAFLNLIRSVGFFDLNLKEAERLLKAFLRQEPLDRREALIDLKNSVVHMNYIEESISKIILNADALMNTLASRQKNSQKIFHLPGTYEHFRELAKEIHESVSLFEQKKDVISKVEKVVAWIMHYREKEVKTTHKAKKAFFALLRSVERYDKALESAYLNLSNFTAIAGANKNQEKKFLTNAKQSLAKAEKAISIIVKDTKALVNTVKREEEM